MAPNPLDNQPREPLNPAFSAPQGLVKRDAMSRLLARNWGWILLRGIVALAVGALMLLVPGAALAGIVLGFAVYMTLDGIAAIVSAVRAAAHHERWGWFMMEGMVGLAVGAAAFFQPHLAILTFVFLVSAWAVITGGLMLAAAFNLRTDHGRWWLGLGGAVSLIWGLLLLIQPAWGAVVLTIWLGAYALIFGVSLVILALKLRGRHGFHRAALMPPVSTTGI